MDTSQGETHGLPIILTHSDAEDLSAAQPWRKPCLASTAP
jgi:hypothetical protein